MTANVNWPTMKVEVDFTNDPTSTTDTWTDITTYCRVHESGGMLDTARGRSYELAHTDTGTFVVSLDNSDGRFDPANASSPYYPNVLPMRKIRIRATWSATTYGVIRGYVEEWPQSWQAAGFFGVTTAAGTDALSPLSMTDLVAMPIAEALADTPLALYPLTDSTTSATAGNISATTQPVAHVKVGKILTSINFTFGGVAGSGKLAADPSTGLNLTAHWLASLNDGGYCLRTADSGLGPMVTSAGFTVEGWFYSTNSTQNASAVLFEQIDHTGLRQAQVFLSSVTGGYAPSFQINDGTHNATLNATTNITDSAWHHIVMTLGADGKTVTGYIDGVSAGTAAAASAMSWAAGWQQNWGGTFSTNTAWYPPGSGFFTGSMKNLAIYSTVLNSTRVPAHFNAGNGFSGDDTGTRVGRLLDYASWPSSLRSLDTGNSTLCRQMTDGQKASQALQDAVDSEAGNLFISRDGNVVFKNRLSRGSAASVATFGDGAGENPYESDITVSRDPREVYNQIELSRPDGISVRNINTASMSSFYPRVLSRTLYVDSDTQVVDMSDWLVGRYKDSRDRIPQITIVPSANTSLWAQALGREIGDRITVKRRPGSATQLSGDYIIEKVQHSVAAGSWRTTFLLSPASIENYWVIEDATYGYIEGSGGNISYPIEA